jgi:hypothetical protein
MKNTIQNLKMVTLAILLSLGLNFVYAWALPTAPPPNGNADAPITTKGGQTINGNLTIKGTVATPAVLTIGTPAEPGILNITGLKIDGIAPQAGQVLAFETATLNNPANVKWEVGGGGGSPSLPSGYLNATPNSVAWNASANLTWNIQNADSCVASGGWSGNKAVLVDSAESTLSLAVTAVYQLDCTGPGGSNTFQTTITVGAQPSAPTVDSFSASAVSVPYNGSTVLSWSSTDATSCVPSGPSDWSSLGIGVDGNQTISNIKVSPSVYTITCTVLGGFGGSDTKSVTVTIPPATATLSYNNVVLGGNSYNTYPSLSACENTFARTIDLQWSSTNASSCVASGNTSGTGGVWSNSTLTSGVKQITQKNICQQMSAIEWGVSNYFREGTYNLSCSGPSGVGTATMPIDPTVNFGFNPATRMATWSSVGAVLCLPATDEETGNIPMPGLDFSHATFGAEFIPNTNTGISTLGITCFGIATGLTRKTVNYGVIPY